MTDSNPNEPEPDRLHELLADGATVGLSDAERAELRALLGSDADDESAEYDAAAAAVALALTPSAGPVPPALRARVEATMPGAAAPAAPVPVAPKRRRALLAWAGWAVAACALVALGVREFAPRPTAAEMRARLVANDPRALVLEGATPAGETAAGSIVWSHDRQEGYLTLRNLPQLKNQQLQLWIFDAERDERYPVDGGAFDATAGEVVIPIRAAVPVRRAALFALTVEPVGGVVVSARERIVWTAKPG
jgi:anti-sigma-K factor RskA